MDDTRVDFDSKAFFGSLWLQLPSFVGFENAVHIFDVLLRFA